MKDLLGKLYDDSCEISEKLELMQYALTGLAEECSEAYCIKDYFKDITTEFFDFQEEIEEIMQKEYRQRLNLK